MDTAKGPFTTQHNPPFRTAIVYALESVAPYRVRVQFPDRDNLISWWLPVMVKKIQDDKDFWQPDLGEQVCVQMDEYDENGIVLGSVPSLVDFAPAGLTPADRYTQVADGTVIHYNRTTHQLTVTLCAGGEMTLTQPSGGKIALDASGNVEIQAAASVSLSGGGAAASDALALVSKLVTAFNAHYHKGSGASVTPEVPWTAATVESTLVKVSG
jgi:phage baseplate assembly protein V